MNDRSADFNALHKKQMIADECEKQRLEQVDAMARKTMQEQKERLQANQAELFRQMDERQ